MPTIHPHSPSKPHSSGIHDIDAYVQAVGAKAKSASRTMAMLTTAQKNALLLAIKTQIQDAKAAILNANATDVQDAHTKGLEPSLIDRLIINDQRFDAMIASLDDVIALADPIGEITALTPRPSGILLGRMRVPLGVLGMIYESRPNVTLEAASLAIKSGNAIILRGGSEAIGSNQAIARAIHQGFDTVGINRDGVQVIATIDRQAVHTLITLKDFVDIIIPRGGKGLVSLISKSATIPVIKHLDGNCHTYIDSDANHDMAIKIAVNAKTSRYAPCNATETLLIHADCAHDLLPQVTRAMSDVDAAMQYFGCVRTLDILKADPKSCKLAIYPATEEDWYAEYLAPKLAIKVVDSMQDAIDHINHYGSHHTDVIITDNIHHANDFIRQVDSSSVMVNASSRFADGFEYGLGAEIGISTDKIHARGPVGLHGLTSQKWVVYGHGEIRP